MLCKFLACSDMATLIQIQRKLQIQIEDQGKRLQMMFEKQREMGDSKVNVSLDEPSAAAPSDTVETTNEERHKFESIPKAIPEEKESSTTKQIAGEAEEMIKEDEVAPPTKRVKSS